MSSNLSVPYVTVASVAREHLDAHARLMGYTTTHLNCFRSDLKITCFVRGSRILNAMSFNGNPNYHLIYGKMPNDSWKIFERGAELFAYMKDSVFENLQAKKVDEIDLGDIDLKDDDMDVENGKDGK